MKKHVALFSVILLGFAATAALAIDIPLKYVKYPEKTEEFFPYGSSRAEMTLKPPAGEWKLPELFSQQPIYMLAKLGDTERLMVFDRQKAEDSFYNRIYYDANGNRDLTDDDTLDGTFREQGSMTYVEMAPVDTEVSVEGKTLPYSFLPYLIGYNLAQLEDKELEEKTINRNVIFYLRPHCMYTASFKQGGREYHISLGDTNCNGRFADVFKARKFSTAIPRRMSIYGEGDNFYISASEELSSFDSQYLGEWLVIEDTLYELAISTADKKITLTPVSQGLAGLKLSMRPEVLTLNTEDENNCVMMIQPAEVVKVPEGRYRLLYYKIHKEDEQGDLWRLCASGSTESPYFTVDASNGAECRFGEPYVPFVETRNTNSARGTYLMFNVEGGGRELLSDLSHIKGEKTEIALSEAEGATQRPKEPSYRIVKADGEIVTQGDFEYG
jgi:hypothetical protein